MDARKGLRGYAALEGPGGEGHPHLRGERAVRPGSGRGHRHEPSVGPGYGRPASWGSCWSNVEKPGALLQRFPDPPNKGGSRHYEHAGHRRYMLEKRPRVSASTGPGHLVACAIPTVFKAITTGEPYQPRNWMERSGNKHAMIGNAGQAVEDHRQDGDDLPSVHVPHGLHHRSGRLRSAHAGWLESYFTIAHANKIIIRQPVVHLYETVNEASSGRRSRIVAPSWAIRSSPEGWLRQGI